MSDEAVLLNAEEEVEEQSIPFNPFQQQAPQAPVPGGVVQPIPVAATVYLKDGERAFKSDAGTWGFCAYGVYAGGKWESDDAQELDVLIPYEQIDLIVYDFNAGEEAEDEGSSS